jgi:4-hydroxyphenylpyruvate dioxygenase-like putative hemolysin
MPRKRGSGDGGLYYIKSRKLWRGVVNNGYWPDGRRRQACVHDRDAADHVSSDDAREAMTLQSAYYRDVLTVKGIE